MRPASNHAYATSDEEEQLALSLALEASLADAGHSAHKASFNGHTAAGSSHQRQQQRSQPASAPPHAPGANGSYVPEPNGWQSQLPPPGWQHQAAKEPNQHHQPWSAYPSGNTPAQQPQQSPGQAAQPQHQTGIGSSNGSSMLQSLMQKPVKMLDTALKKMSSESSIRCAGCGKSVAFGPAVRALGQQWHPQCFRCAGCSQPLTGASGETTFAVGQDGQPYHSTCHKQLFHPKCGVCQDYIPTRADGRTEWREHPFWMAKHCPRHYSDGTLQCCSCGRLQPLLDEWVSLQDGRQLCLQCLDTLVIDTKQAQPLYDEILNFYNSMGMPHPYKVPLLLVEGPVLDEYADKEGRRQDAAHAPMFSVRGLCVAHVYTTIPSVVRAAAGAAAVSSIFTRMAPTKQHCSVSCILVMYGLPRLLLGSIVAHELMHAYLRMRHVTGLPLQIEEGLCQLLAMLWLDSQDWWAKAHGEYQETLLSYLGYQIRTDTSEVYGEGFRIAMEKFQQRGLKALVEHVIAHGAWPSWHA